MCIAHRFVSVDGTRVFFREAGDPAAPAVLLLHGFPTSSHVFRALIPELAGQYHVVAPDLPGFGFSDAPPRDAFAYTFDHLAQVIERLTESIGLAHYALYVFDYGAPIGFRLALAHPERIAALISQNGNAYVEGLSEGWNPIQRYWQHPTPANRAALREFLHAEATRWQYTYGVTEPERVAPESFTLDQHFLDRPGLDEIQLDLFLDYRTNVALYPRFQDYLRTHQPPTLAVWGENDPFFLPAGAQAFRRDVPTAKVQFIPSGHFPLETHAAQVARIIRAFLVRALAPAVPQDGANTPPAAAQDSLDQMHKLFGFVPNLAVAMAAEPSALDAYLEMLKGLGSSSLTPLEQQVVMIAASYANEALYNVAVHATIATQLGGDTAMVRAVSEGRPLADARLEALRLLAEALTVGRGQARANVVERFRAVGYGQAALVAVTLGVATMSFATGVAHLTRPALETAFLPRTATAVTN
jgi:pimeloyl-ACP methyl ester carboxylesterase/alkylhydroperoxidase family enzyme